MNQLQPIEHQNRRVLTTLQLAEAYGTDARRISENFNANKDRYKYGKHYFLLEGPVLKAFSMQYGNSVSVNRVSKLYLWTEVGAWMHAKSLNTDKAWEAYEYLVDDYYKKNEMIAQLYQLSPEVRALINIELKQKEIESKLNKTEHQLEVVNYRINNLDKVDHVGNLQQRLNKMVRKYATETGLTFPAAWKRFREAYNTAFRTNITLLIENYKLKNGLKNLSVPEYLAKVNLLEDAIRVADKLLNQVS